MAIDTGALTAPKALAGAWALAGIATLGVPALGVPTLGMPALGVPTLRVPALCMPTTRDADETDSGMVGVAEPTMRDGAVAAEVPGVGDEAEVGSKPKPCRDGIIVAALAKPVASSPRTAGVTRTRTLSGGAGDSLPEIPVGS